MLFQLDLFLRIIVAAFCGSIIGYERAQRMKAAGVRTHILVSTASALFIIISKYSFDDLLGHTNIALDPSRVAAQVVSGISFIGAGTILIRNQNINGLTTAAGLWIMSGIGMALGAGMYFIGIVTTILIVVVQYFMRARFLHEIIIRKEKVKFTIEANYSAHIKQDITQLLESNGIENISFTIFKIDRGTIYLNVTGKVAAKGYSNNKMIENLIDLDDINSVT
ncbi:MgtC/SapB family protein [Staphylococcus sp. SQ8-PEA]|uniref:MgtC/SapB family protein n=1 Tax=Staphylococcus marylandisciuri TaxID=2981529 RepID=A0ABT2QQK8_9STAP|nr:MgtC/SapB family protein [Staphylococcus marylandisciuri]MCU5746272.1 MgtC/SapB family protein [Staphylococcus marylandisciuri]